MVIVNMATNRCGTKTFVVNILVAKWSKGAITVDDATCLATCVVTAVLIALVVR